MNHLMDFLHVVLAQVQSGNCSWADWIAAAMVAIFLGLGLANGLTGIIIPIVAMILGLRLAGTQWAIDLARQYTGFESYHLLFGTVLTVSMVIGVIVKGVIRTMFNLTIILALLDRLGGAIVGIVAAALVISASSDILSTASNVEVTSAISDSVCVSAAKTFTTSVGADSLLNIVGQKAKSIADPLSEELPGLIKQGTEMINN